MVIIKINESARRRRPPRLVVNAIEWHVEQRTRGQGDRETAKTLVECQEINGLQAEEYKRDFRWMWQWEKSHSLSIIPP